MRRRGSTRISIDARRLIYTIPTDGMGRMTDGFVQRDTAELQPAPTNTLKLSVLIPARNEEANIGPTVEALGEQLRSEGIPFEILVVDDGSADHTADSVRALEGAWPELRMVRNSGLPGLGRAIRTGLPHVRGDALAVMMADRSDHPHDLVRCYRTLEAGYDCVFGSRFLKGSVTTAYPPLKLAVNRVANKLIQVMFMTPHNDLTNAFKVYRRHVIEEIGPLHASHFNITIEMSLSALIRGYSIAMIPIHWSGRTWGSSKLRLREMGRRYLCTLLKIWCERVLIQDDLIAEAEDHRHIHECEAAPCRPTQPDHHNKEH